MPNSHKNLIQLPENFQENWKYSYIPGMSWDKTPVSIKIMFIRVVILSVRWSNSGTKPRYILLRPMCDKMYAVLNRNRLIHGIVFKNILRLHWHWLNTVGFIYYQHATKLLSRGCQIVSQCRNLNGPRLSNAQEYYEDMWI